MSDELQDQYETEQDDDTIDIRIMKLSNGEEIIGGIVDETDAGIIVYAPMKILRTIEHNPPDENSYQKFSLVAWYSEIDIRNPVPIHKHHLVSLATPLDMYVDFYMDSVEEDLETNMDLYNALDEIADDDSDDTPSNEESFTASADTNKTLH